MSPHRIVQPEGWPRPSGFAHGVSARGRVVAVAGQVGWNPRTGKFESDDLVGQVRQALENIVAVLRAGGATPAHLVRMAWYVLDRDAYDAAKAGIGEAYRETIGSHFPAMSLFVVAGLLEHDALVEIEATAMVPEQ